MHAPKPPVPTADALPEPRHPSQPSGRPPRFALYFTPPSDSAWSVAGCQWLGRDAYTGAPILQPQVDGITPASVANLTADPRRYGFHATLKAPFALAEGHTETQLLAMAADFCRHQPPVPLHGLGVRLVRGGFLALCPAEPVPHVDALAQRCVDRFDSLRAPPTAEYLARRRGAGLSARQETLLLRWGYPYTEEAFRFHMTLSGNLGALDSATVTALLHAANLHFAQVLAAPLSIDGLTVLKEAEYGAPFLAVERFEFAGRPTHHRRAHA